MTAIAEAAVALAMPDLLYEAGENGAFVFLFATLVIGGTAAYITGRAVAETWRPPWQLPFYLVLIAAGVRFLHFAVFEGPMLSARSFLTDLVSLALIGVFGHWVARRRQMREQYGWRR